MNARFSLVTLVLGLIAMPVMAQTYGPLPQPLDYSEPLPLFGPPSTGSYAAPVFSQNTTVYGQPAQAVQPAQPAPLYAPPATQYNPPTAQPVPLYAPPATQYNPPAVQPVPLYGTVTTSGLTASYTPAPAYAPTVSYAPVQPAAIAPVCCHRPSAPYAPPVVTYRPVVQVGYNQPAASPNFVTYNTYAPVAAPVAAIPGPRVYAKTKYYVEGQPIRNFFRAITP